jgi:hypothetical protein
VVAGAGIGSPRLRERTPVSDSMLFEKLLELGQWHGFAEQIALVQVAILI